MALFLFSRCVPWFAPANTQCTRTGVVPIFGGAQHLLRLSYRSLVVFCLPVRYKRLSYFRANMNTAHFEQIIVPAPAKPPTAPQPLRSVGQDNPTPPRARTGTSEPAPLKNTPRPQPMNSKPARVQNRPTPKRQTIHTTLHLKRGVRAELERRAKEEHLSVSATGAAILEWYFKQSIYTQQAATLETAIAKAIGKHMRAYSNRLAVLLVRSLFTAEQTRSFAVNILGRLPGMSEAELTQIKDGANNTARANITRISPQMKTLIEAVETWLAEVAGEVNVSG
jgi:hypothetical protein